MSRPCLKSCKRSGGFSDGVREHSRMVVLVHVVHVHVVIKYKEQNDICVLFLFSFSSFCRNDQLLVGSMVQELNVRKIERALQDPRCFVVRIYSKEVTV